MFNACFQTQTVVINGQQYQIVTPAATMEVQYKNIATGETSQAITPFHFFDYFDFSNFYH